MKIMVTGGAGFIGSRVALEYFRLGHEVVIIDNLSAGSREKIFPGAVFYESDIRSADMEVIFEKERPNIINHHAAQKSVPASVANPIPDADVNIMGLLNLLSLSSKYKIEKFISISSGGAISGDVEGLPSKEECTPSEASPYAISKLAGEIYVRYFSTAYGMKYTILRYANVYGPGQAADGECGVIPIFFGNMLGNKPSSLYTFSDMPQGTSRDYIYVDDLVKANVAALDKGDGQVINIGSGKETYTRDLYDGMLMVCNKKLPLLAADARKGDVQRSVLDIGKAKKVLDWSPETSLREGLSLTFEWLTSKT